MQLLILFMVVILVSVIAVDDPPRVNLPQILFIGDSIDRNVVQLLCQKYSMNHTLINGDGDPYENPDKYKTLRWGGLSTSVYHGDRTKQPSIFCHLNSTSPPGGVVAYLHIFGSYNGVYEYVNTDTDPYSLTSARIKYALQFWRDEMPEKHPAKRYPDKIFFNSIMWDLRHWYIHGAIKREDEESMHEAQLKFKTDVLERLSEIRRYVGNSSELVIRTAPHSDTTDEDNTPYGKNTPGEILKAASHLHSTGDMCTSFNKGLREIAMEENLSFWDYELFMWEKAGYNITRLQMEFYYDHQSHPVDSLSTEAGEIILGLQKNHFYTKRSGIQEGSPLRKLGNTNAFQRMLLHSRTRSLRRHRQA